MTSAFDAASHALIGRKPSWTAFTQEMPAREHRHDDVVSAVAETARVLAPLPFAVADDGDAAAVDPSFSHGPDFHVIIHLDLLHS